MKLLEGDNDDSSLVAHSKPKPATATTNPSAEKEELEIEQIK